MFRNLDEWDEWVEFTTRREHRVSISLTTHDMGALSNLDVELARAANHYFGS